jgi:hypothetical protein
VLAARVAVAVEPAIVEPVLSDWDLEQVGHGAFLPIEPAGYLVRA